MLQFFVTTIFMISLGTILYVLVRSLPRIDEEPSGVSERSALERWVASEIPERIDGVVNAFMGKFLRKLKIFLLKVDNSLTDRLQKIKSPNGSQKPKIDFADLGANSNTLESESKVAEEGKLDNN